MTRIRIAFEHSLHLHSERIEARPHIRYAGSDPDACSWWWTDHRVRLWRMTRKTDGLASPRTKTRARANSSSMTLSLLAAGSAGCDGSSMTTGSMTGCCVSGTAGTERRCSARCLLRHLKTRLAFNPCSSATRDADAPGCIVFSTIPRLNSREKFGRLPTGNTGAMSLSDLSTLAPTIIWWTPSWTNPGNFARRCTSDAYSFPGHRLAALSTVLMEVGLRIHGNVNCGDRQHPSHGRGNPDGRDQHAHPNAASSSWKRIRLHTACLVRNLGVWGYVGASADPAFTRGASSPDLSAMPAYGELESRSKRKAFFLSVNPGMAPCQNNVALLPASVGR